MAQFRGTINGQRGEASRLGSKKSGVRMTAASWEGAVEVLLSHDAEHGGDVCEVWFKQHRGNGSHRLLYSGPVSGCPVEVAHA